VFSGGIEERLSGEPVVPRRLLDAGFTLRFPEWPAAAEDLCARWRHAI